VLYGKEDIRSVYEVLGASSMDLLPSSVASPASRPVVLVPRACLEKGPLAAM
jgi:hypothetical protein